MKAKVKASMEEEQRLLKAFLTFELERKEEKRSLAIRLYENNVTQEEIAKILAVAQSTVSEWLKKIRDAKEEERKRLF